MFDYVKTFQELGKNDISIAGGKGASLGEMTQAGIPVPPGFVVLAVAFEQFLKETDLNVEIDNILHEVKQEAMHTVEKASENIQALIMNARMPVDIAVEITAGFKNLDAPFVAVRSSATAEDAAGAAWAGQLDSFLNTTEEKLLENVQRCFASLFTPRAIFYRFEKELHLAKISVAVVVQKMIESEISGIAFSVHPVTEDSNQLIIEAGYGLGEAIVSGQITPDSYVVEKSSSDSEQGRTLRRIIDKNISMQERGLYRAALYSSKVPRKEGNEWRDIPVQKRGEQKLSDKQMLELTELILRIETHYGFPCDIEWALAEDTFYILQSRPITTLKNRRKQDETTISSIASIDEGKYDFLWTVGGFHYLFISTWLTDEVIKWDFINTYRDGIWTCYLSRQDRRILSDMGYTLYTTGFEKYRREVILATQIAKEFLEGERRISLHDASDGELSDRFKQIVEKAQEIWRLYFWTEYFCTDKVAKELLQGNSSKELTSNVNEMGKMKYVLRSLVNELGLLSVGLLHDYCQEISTRLHISYEQVITYHFGEILSALSGEKLGGEDRSAVVVGKFSDWRPIFGSRASKIIKLFSGDCDADAIKILKGSSGNRGVYKGKVKKIDFSFQTNFIEEIAKMKKGDVLVSGSTGPEMILACKKAGAIVTDEGGIISHAAIVSRELGIPCVIGTKTATKVLKDGDIVEVDAEKGVVRILQSRPITTLAKSFSPATQITDIASKGKWIKRWAGSYTFISSSHWGMQYYINLKKELGVGFNHTLFIHERGVVTFLLLKSEFESFGRAMVKKLVADEGKSLALLDALRVSTDRLTLIMKRLEGKIPTPQEYSEFKKYFSYHLPLHNFMKKTPDFMPDELRQKFFARFMDARLHSEHVYSDTERFFRSVATAIGEKEHIAPELLTCLTEEDFELYLTKLILPDVETLQSRWDESVLYFEEGKQSVFVGEKASTLKGCLEQRRGMHELKGVSAYGGTVRGVARVILDPHAKDMFAEGDILITGMTRPEFLPLVKKAAAIITDAGGTLCHAAIIAREMRKPCIVGTESATGTIRDGDYLEVNADSGIVRIINVNIK